MAIRVASHLYRNRHGTFYFRLIVPADLRSFVGRGDIRLSLGTEQRQAAIIASLVLIADLPRLTATLKRMSENDETLSPDYFQLWRSQILKNAELSAKLAILNDELQEREDQLLAMVPRQRAKEVAKQAYSTGQLKGQNELVERLVFPWPPERTVLFSELLKSYMLSFSYRAHGGRKKPPGEKTLEGYETDIKMFIAVMGDVRIGLIDRDVAGEYFNILRRLPANMNRVAAYRGKTIPELLDMRPKPQSEYNASKKMERISGMYRWALDEKRKWGIDDNPFTGFGQSGENQTDRRPFTSDELQALLKHPSFIDRKFTTAYSYWLIPLALYTGARLGELCQLDLKDFVEVEGIPCIDINDVEAVEDSDEPGTRAKRVKTKNAKRLVPIHPELIRLGILRYVETLRQSGQAHLFPELSRTRRDGPAHAASNWFQRYRKKVGVTAKQQTVFHSFRHGFITTLLDAGVTPHLVAPIVGHEGELITGKVYWNKKDAEKRKPTVDRFSLSTDVSSLIPVVEDVLFVASPGPKRRSSHS
ncbi:MAG: site-specific integrase [Hylemonella sp.]|nr:site-specific integrase [Hylemonella sp.]